MGWVNDALKELSETGQCTIRPEGGSMRGRIESGQLVTIKSVGPTELQVEDAAFVKWKGNYLLHIIKEIKGEEYDEDVLTDVLCIAINHLPPRYIRHEIDFLYYMSPIERQEIEEKAAKAIKDALAYIKDKKRS